MYLFSPSHTQLLEFAYRYMTDVLGEDHLYSEHADSFPSPTAPFPSLSRSIAPARGVRLLLHTVMLGEARVAQNMQLRFTSQPPFPYCTPFPSSHPHQLLEFAYRYMTDVLGEARVYAEHAGHTALEVDDVRLAVQAKVSTSFSQPPPREVLMELARARNAVPIPPIAGSGLFALPPEAECLLQPNVQIAVPLPGPAARGSHKRQREGDTGGKAGGRGGGGKGGDAVARVKKEQGGTESLQDGKAGVGGAKDRALQGMATVVGISEGESERETAVPRTIVAADWGFSERVKVACRLRPPSRAGPLAWAVAANTVVAARNPNALTPCPSPQPTPRSSTSDSSSNSAPHSSHPSRVSHTLQPTAPLPAKALTFEFNHVFGYDSSNFEVYTEFCKGAVERAVAGCRAVVLVYGQTGTGKTHTISGSNLEAGVFHHAMADVFRAAQNADVSRYSASCPTADVSAAEREVVGALDLSTLAAADTSPSAGNATSSSPGEKGPPEAIQSPPLMCFLSVVEIYNERAVDLLQGAKPSSVQVKENGSSRSGDSSKTSSGSSLSHAAGRKLITEQQLHSVEEAAVAFELAGHRRKVRGTSRNKQSSRSHMLYVIRIRRTLPGSGAEGGAKREARRRETESINKSLLALTSVLTHLSQARPGLPPYRQSLLTRLLQPCLGGRSGSGVGGNGGSSGYCAVLFCIDPQDVHVSKTTLRYSAMTRRIRMDYQPSILSLSAPKHAPPVVHRPARRRPAKAPAAEAHSHSPTPAQGEKQKKCVRTGADRLGEVERRRVDAKAGADGKGKEGEVEEEKGEQGGKMVVEEEVRVVVEEREEKGLKERSREGEGEEEKSQVQSPAAFHQTLHACTPPTILPRLLPPYLPCMVSKRRSPAAPARTASASTAAAASPAETNIAAAELGCDSSHPLCHQANPWKCAALVCTAMQCIALDVQSRGDGEEEGEDDRLFDEAEICLKQVERGEGWRKMDLERHQVLEGEDLSGAKEIVKGNVGGRKKVKERAVVLQRWLAMACVCFSSQDDVVMV
ncbi:unnamed protein product [Closterium sp. Yama58-4]|nr:unnamed protein product [Closterium sp. Yama58-4]